MFTSPLTRLADEFRREAEILRRWGSTEAADAAEAAAERIQAALQEWQSEALTIADAAKASGYSEAHLRRLVAECRIESQGPKGRPRIRRRDLPKKLTPKRTGEPDLVGEVMRAKQEHGL